MYDPESNEYLTLVEAVDKGLIDPTQTVIKIPGASQNIDLEEAIERGLIEPHTSSLTDPVSGKLISLSDAIQSGQISDTKPMLSLQEASDKGLLDPSQLQNQRSTHR